MVVGLTWFVWRQECTETRKMQKWNVGMPAHLLVHNLVIICTRSTINSINTKRLLANLGKNFGFGVQGVYRPMLDGNL